MPRYIVKIKDQYLEWSTIVDAPVTYGMTEQELLAYHKRQYGNEGLDERLARVAKKGTSAIEDDLTLAALVRGNRAGPNEKRLTLAQIYKRYCVERNA